MRTDLYWVKGPWLGRLAIMPRPRGGDWLEDEIQGWRRSGVDLVLSLLTADEMDDLSLAAEEGLCRAAGIQFISFPIRDRDVPPSKQVFLDLISKLAKHLAGGKNIAVHCRQGIGRAGLVAICLLVFSGMDPKDAIEQVSATRGCPVPETLEQQEWIVDFARPLMTPLPK